MLNLQALGPLFAMKAPPARSANMPPRLTAAYKQPAVKPLILRGNTSAAHERRQPYWTYTTAEGTLAGK